MPVFIYLHRNPCEVYLSSLRLHKRLIGQCALQPEEEESIARMVPALYANLLRKYEEEKHLIPRGHLIEIAYEDLLEKPPGTSPTNLPGIANSSLRKSRNRLPGIFGDPGGLSPGHLSPRSVRQSRHR